MSAVQTTSGRIEGSASQVVTLDPMTLDAVLDSIAEVGTALGAEAEATELVLSLRGRLDRLGRVVSSHSAIRSAAGRSRLSYDASCADQRVI